MTRYTRFAFTTGSRSTSGGDLEEVDLLAHELQLPLKFFDLQSALSGCWGQSGSWPRKGKSLGFNPVGHVYVAITPVHSHARSPPYNDVQVFWWGNLRAYQFIPLYLLSHRKFWMDVSWLGI